MKYLLIFIFTVFFAHVAVADEIIIAKVEGDVKVRRGVDENWQTLHLGAPLEMVDTILSGENGQIVLMLPNGRKFTLGSNSILDMADLKNVTDRELFLFLMKQKIGKLEKRNKPTPLRVGKVSLVHGTKQKNATDQMAEKSADELTDQIRYKNGIIALYNQQMYPNAIVKIHRSLSASEISGTDPEVYFYLGEALASVNKNGQAMDAFNKVLELCKENQPENTKWEKFARNGLEKLK